MTYNDYLAGKEMPLERAKEVLKNGTKGWEGIAAREAEQREARKHPQIVLPGGITKGTVNGKDYFEMSRDEYRRRQAMSNEDFEAALLQDNIDRYGQETDQWIDKEYEKVRQQKLDRLRKLNKKG